MDHFILARLEARGLTLSPDAPPATLARRAYLDLIGLPPSPEELDAFLSDPNPNAYERLIDRLLASPHFGERWGRHWLDAAGYVDTVGLDNDAGITKVQENFWRYRDFVVRSLNEDKPYDRFLTEQIAGDEMVDWRRAREFTPEIRDLLTATGFLRTAADSTTEAELNRPLERFQVLHGTVDIIGTSVLGLTLGCARCHDHKYDPVKQREFYAMQAFFTPAYNPAAWVQPPDRFLADVPLVERERIDRHNSALEKEIAERKEQAERAKADLPKRAAIEAEIRALGERRLVYGKIPALWDVGAPPQTRLLLRGDHETPGDEVHPGFPAVLGPPGGPAAAPPAVPHPGTSGRRLALARWLTRPDHPLTARVMVNRAWQHLLGTGIVATPDNFGRSGAPPTHPELLDWLALRFIAGGREGTEHGGAWSLKSLIRLIVTSSVYRQASGPADCLDAPQLNSARMAGIAQALDPGNRLLWRQRLRRLESEAVRDAMLAAGGGLDRTLGGPPIPLENRPDGSVVLSGKAGSAPSRSARRSLYVLARRNYQLSMLAVFDQPVVSINCTRRVHSTVPLQALALLNNEFVVDQATALADRALTAAAGPEGQIDSAFRLVLGRAPRADERLSSMVLLRRQYVRYRAEGLAPEAAHRRALSHVCQALFCANEFLYVE